MRWVPALIMLFSLVSGGCGSTSNIETKEAVQKAVEAYLQQRPNLALANMSLEVAEVKFEGETATAEVKFRSKQSSALVVSVHYKLKKSGDGWQVETSTPGAGAGGNPHGTVPSSNLPPGHGATPLESSH